METLPRGQDDRGGDTPTAALTQKGGAEFAPTLKTQHRIKEAVAMLVAKRSFPEVEERLGVRPATVRSWRRRYRALWKREYARAHEQWGIRQATAHLAGGKALKATAEALGIPYELLRDWRRRRKELWMAELDRAMEIVQILLANDESEGVRQLLKCQRWIENKEGALGNLEETQARNLSGEINLTEFYRCYVGPEVLEADGVSPRTLYEYETALRYWQTATGDPPLKEIGGAHCREFVKFLADLPGRNGGKLSVASIRKRCADVQRCLNLAGPPIGHHCENADLYGYVRKTGPDGESILERKAVPYIKRPHSEVRPVKTIFSDGQLEALLGVCHLATKPVIPEVAPADFWWALFTFIDNVGTRIMTTMLAEWEMVDHHVLKMPARILKGKNDRECWVNDLALEAVEKIRTNDRRLFSYHGSLRMLHRERRRLMEAAGVYEPGSGFHRLRSRLATRIARRNPLAAAKQLGHGSIAVTEQHYIHVEALEDVFRELSNGS